MLPLMCEMFQGNKFIHFENIATLVKCTTLSHEKFILNTFFTLVSHYLKVLQWILILFWRYETHSNVYILLGQTGIVINFLVTEIFKGVFFFCSYLGLSAHNKFTLVLHFIFTFSHLRKGFPSLWGKEAEVNAEWCVRPSCLFPFLIFFPLSEVQ